MDSPEEEFSDGSPRFVRHARAACRSVVVSGFATLLTAVLAPSAAQAQGTQTKRLLLYTGTTGFRHTDGINGGRPVVQSALEAAGYTVDWEDCTNNGGGANNCDNANKNPRIFTRREPRSL